MSSRNDVDYSNCAATWSPKDNWYFQKGHENTNTLIITFSGFGVDGTGPPFIFTKFFKDLPHDRLYIRDLKCNWYLNGIQKATDNVPQTLEWIRSLFTRKYESIYTVGCSSGGLAAVLYGLLLEAKGIYAFSPQIVLSVAKLPADKRFENSCSFIRGCDHSVPYLNMKELSLWKDTIPVHVYFGAKNVEDTFQAEWIADIPGVHLHPIETAQHTSALYLKSRGELHTVFEFWC
jgi:hypothetical protein